jgi:hypothetical protein
MGKRSIQEVANGSSAEELMTQHIEKRICTAVRMADGTVLNVSEIGLDCLLLVLSETKIKSSERKPGIGKNIVYPMSSLYAAHQACSDTRH